MNARSTESVVGLQCTVVGVLVVSADTGILWNGARLLLICAHRDINILSVISVYLLKNISYFKNLYVFESWWIQTPSLCVFVYKSSDKIHISLFLQTLKLCDNILSEMRNFHQIITKLLVIYFANNLKDVWTSIVKIVCALRWFNVKVLLTVYLGIAKCHSLLLWNCTPILSA